ncbi:hypothetical protein [Gordonia sp. NPDC003376]
MTEIRALTPILLNRARLLSPSGLLIAAAFGSCTAIALTVAGGAWAFLHWEPFAQEPDLLGIYQFLAVFAGLLLGVPVAALGAAAAKLSARSVDARLSTLSLLGARRSTIMALGVLQPMIPAITGVLGGTAASYLLIIPFSRIHFQGEPLGYAAMLLPPWAVLAVAILLVLSCASGAVRGLRRITVTPMGVRTRSLPPASPRRRIAAVLALVAATAGIFAALRIFGASAGNLVLIGGLCLFLLGGLAVVNTAGVLLVRLVATRSVRGARSPDSLIAARLVLAEPMQFWRRVSPLALTSFIASVIGTGISLSSNEDRAGMSGPAGHVAGDITTGIQIVLGVSFLLITVSAVVSQAADVYDRATTYRDLYAAGMSVCSLHRMTVATTMKPAMWVSVITGLSGIVLVLPLTGIALLTQSATLLTMLGSILAGLAIMRLGLAVTRPLISGITGGRV